jgi:hypothetical protein
MSIRLNLEIEIDLRDKAAGQRYGLADLLLGITRRKNFPGHLFFSELLAESTKSHKIVERCA